MNGRWVEQEWLASRSGRMGGPVCGGTGKWEEEGTVFFQEMNGIGSERDPNLHAGRATGESCDAAPPGGGELFWSESGEGRGLSAIRLQRLGV